MIAHNPGRRSAQSPSCEKCRKYLLDREETNPCVDILLRDRSLEQIRLDLQTESCDRCRFYRSLFGAIRDVRRMAANVSISEDFEADEISFISPDCLHVILQGKNPRAGNANKLTAEVYTHKKKGRCTSGEPM